MNTWGFSILNRLTADSRGTLNSAHDGLSGTAEATQGWDLDAVGNVWDKQTDGGHAPREYNLRNQMTEIGSSALDNDANGNATGESGYQYVYDAWNHLKRVQDPGDTTIQSHDYDGLGRRIDKGSHKDR